MKSYIVILVIIQTLLLRVTTACKKQQISMKIENNINDGIFKKSPSCFYEYDEMDNYLSNVEPLPEIECICLVKKLPDVKCACKCVEKPVAKCLPISTTSQCSCDTPCSRGTGNIGTYSCGRNNIRNYASNTPCLIL